MPRKTIKSIAELHGVTVAALQAARTNGLNIFSDADIAAWKRNKRPKVAADAKASGVPTSGEIPTVEELERRLMSATDLATVKILQGQLAGAKVAQQVRADARELVPAGEVRSDITKAVSGARAELLKLAADLPPRLDGLPAGRMQRVIRDAIAEVLERLSDETTKLYQT